MRILYRRLSPESNLCLRLPLFRFLLLLWCTLLRVRGFFGKGNSKKTNTGADARGEHDRDQAGSPCGFQSKVAEPPVPPACFTSPSTLISESPDFALLYSSLLMDNAVPMGCLQEFLSLEKPARRAAKRLQISAASISDSMAATALSVLRREADRRATEVISISDQLLIAADMRPKKFRTKWQRAVYDGPTARKDAELAEEIDGFNSSRICSGQRTHPWEN